MVGDLEKAREAFESAIDHDPGGGLQHYNLGAVLERLGREMDAEVCYRRANECDPHGGMYEAIAALGALLRRQGRLEEAEQIYDLYLSDDSINVEILVEHGICLSDLDRLDEAIDRFDFALSLDPETRGRSTTRRSRSIASVATSKPWARSSGPASSTRATR
nr:tetratricopeptide repeat protein [Nannocystis pusilla]